MVRDILIDVKGHDLLMNDISEPDTPVFDTVWGDIFETDSAYDQLICNIIVPEIYWPTVLYDGSGELVLKMRCAYKADTRSFRVRPVKIKNGEYSLFEEIRGELGLPARSYALTKNIASPIMASMLPYIDTKGIYTVRFAKNQSSELLDRAYIYSGAMSDLVTGFSDDQSAQLLSLCDQGSYYRYPTTGVGITRYINTVVNHTDLSKRLEEQFDGDKKPIYDAEFDSATGDFDVLFNPEKETPDVDLTPVEELDADFFKDFTDEYVRKQLTVSQVGEVEYLNLLNAYDNFVDILFFPNENTQKTRVADTTVAGRLNTDGGITTDPNYYVVSATLEANSLIMFDDEDANNLTGSPLFQINGINETILYQSLVEQPVWISEKCHKCFLLLKHAKIKYTIKKSSYNSGKGLFVVPMSGRNLKNILSIAHDKHTGRLVCLVSENTNISDVVIDGVSQRIYANINQVDNNVNEDNDQDNNHEENVPTSQWQTLSPTQYREFVSASLIIRQKADLEEKNLIHRLVVFWRLPEGCVSVKTHLPLLYPDFSFEFNEINSIPITTRITTSAYYANYVINYHPDDVDPNLWYDPTPELTDCVFAPTQDTQGVCLNVCLREDHKAITGSYIAEILNMVDSMVEIMLDA